MPNSVEIRVTIRGFDVSLGGRVTHFTSLDDAVRFTHDTLRSAEQRREIARRCE